MDMEGSVWWPLCVGKGDLGGAQLQTVELRGQRQPVGMRLGCVREGPSSCLGAVTPLPPQCAQHSMLSLESP